MKCIEGGLVLLLLASLGSDGLAQERKAPRRPPQPAGETGRRASLEGIDLANLQLVELTHELGPHTTAWPGSSQHFQLDTITAGRNAQGNYAALFALALPEHFGTHMDAPHHFAEHGATPAQIPLWRLMAPAVLIDISDSARANRDYTLTVLDIEQFEAEHGRIPNNVIVLVRTGYSDFWSDRGRYFGWDSTVTPVQLHFPGLGEDAARFLVTQRRVAAVGLDAASTDAGTASVYPVHRILADGGIPAFENLADLHDVPPKGSFIVALTPLIVGGSGGPLRAVALIPGSPRAGRPNRR